MARILDRNQRALAEVRVICEADAGVLALTHADHPEALLRYYFGEGGRRVVLAFSRGSVEGEIETRWDGARRSWFVKTSASGPDTDGPRPAA